MLLVCSLDGQSPVLATVLEEWQLLEREPHSLARAKFTEAKHLDAFVMNETATRNLTRLDHAPTLVSVEPLHNPLNCPPAVRRLACQKRYSGTVTPPNLRFSQDVSG